MTLQEQGSKARGELSHEERRLRHIVEATPNAMVMVNATGKVVLVNAQTEKLFGYTRRELLDMHVESLIPERFRSGHHAFRSGFFAHPDDRPMGAGRDLYGRRKDGSEVPIEIGLNPLQTDEGAFVLASVIDITERKRSEERLQRSEERLLKVVEAAPNAMIMVNERGEIVLVNTQTERSFGYAREELLSMRVEDLIPERLRSRHDGYRTGYFAKPDTRAMGAGRDLFGRRKDGSEIPIEIGLSSISIMEENLVLASIIDITERLVSQQHANAARTDQLRQSIFDTLPFSIIATDPHGTIVTANPAAEKLLGFPQRELIGSSIDVVHGRTGAGLLDARTPQATGDDGLEAEYQRRDGTTMPVNEAIAPMTDDDGNTSGFLRVAYDITKRKEAQAFVKHLAHHDVLTDLPNRTMLFEHLDSTIARAALEGSQIAVLLLDLDHFKRVNDSLGHHVGDQLLLKMSARIQQSVREEDLVARLGGDEFVVVFDGLDPDDILVSRINDLMQAMAAPIDVHGHELIVTASMGGATFPQDGLEATTLLKNADTAMYHAKVSGRNNFQWFFQSMLDETNDKIALSSALRHALGQGELSVAYQPQVLLESGEVVGVEALARWDSPQHGMVPPDRFIPVAEDSGMIAELGAWVLTQACRDGVTFGAHLSRQITVAVNVSPRQFRSGDLLQTVKAALAETGFDPKHLELEITEGILMEDPHQVIDVLHEIRGLGVGIVVDDFGTGFSSLAYLTRFPIDKIKIDRSFVRDLALDDADAAIVDTIIVMAHTLNMRVVAEGVETHDQETYLLKRGCDEAQGYLYSEGVPADRVVRSVKAIQLASL